jgi:membrane protein involved in colicin uptake
MNNDGAFDYDKYTDKKAAEAHAAQEKAREAAEKRQIAEVDAKEEAYRKKHKIGPEVKGYQHMIAAEAEEKALRQKAIEELTNKKGTSLNREAARGGSGSGGSGGMGMPKLNRDISKNMKAGGKVSSASKRADGCAVKGKTRGRIV